MADDTKKKAKQKTPTAKKRDIQNEKRRVYNKAFRSRVNSAVKALNATGADVVSSLSAVYSIMDKGVKKGIFTQNKANRFKSRITKKFAAKA